MEKLPMCRICLVENVSMYVVINKNLHELYERLTEVPFVTKDIRPMLACFFCCTKLKLSWRFMRKCLEAEELFTQMMNEDYEQDPPKPKPLEFFNGFINSPVVHVSIVDDGQTDSLVKEELPDACERQDGIIGPKEEDETVKSVLENMDNSYPDVRDVTTHQAGSDSEDNGSLVIKIEEDIEQESIEPEPENLDNSYPEAGHMTADQDESDSEDEDPLMEIKTEGQENGQETIGEPDAKKPKLDAHRANLEETVATEKKKNEKNVQKLSCGFCERSFSSKVHLRRHIRIHTGEKPFKCDICQSSFRQKTHLAAHILIHTGDYAFKCQICQRSFRRKCHLTRHIHVHTGEKPFKCDICHRSFGWKDCLTRHYRKHSGEKPFNCDICQRTFRRKDQVISHIRQHTSVETIFKCDICPRIFNRKSSFTMHLRNYHAVERK